jgi:hypothetical protein
MILAWTALLLLQPCANCGKASKKPGACAGCKFDSAAAQRGYFVGTVQKDGDVYRVNGATLKSRTSLKAWEGKRVRVQGLSQGSVWIVDKIDEAAPQETDLVFRGKVKNADRAVCLRAGLCQEGKADPLFVTETKDAQYVVRAARALRGGGKERYYAVVWDDKDKDGLPNEPAKVLTPIFTYRDGTWFDANNEIVESPAVVELELPN